MQKENGGYQKAETSPSDGVAMYRAAIESSTDGFFLADREGRILDVNDAYVRRSGHTREELLSMRIHDLEEHGDPEKTARHIEEIFREGHGLFETVHRTSDGTIWQVEFNATYWQIDGGRIFCFMREVTAFGQEEERLRKNEEKLQAYLHNISDTIWLIDASLNIAYVSPSVTRLMGVLPGEIIGKPSALVINPDDMGVVTDAQRYVMGHPGQPYTIQYRVIHKDGGWIHVESTGINMLDNPVINGVLVIMRDITERKLAEEALLESESLLRESQIIAGLGSYILDIPTGLWTSTDVLDNLFGIDESYERSVEGWAALVHPDDRTMMADYFRDEVLGQGKTFDKEYRIIRYEDQAERWVHGSGKLEFDSQGRPVKMHGTIQDITGRKKLEEQLRQTQKLESIGTLAGGIAHDFNNLLQGVFGYISLAKVTHDQKERSLSMLEQAEAALHMSVNLTNQLLTFSKGGKPLKKLIRLWPAIENAVKFALSGSRTNYEVDFPADLWSVEADEGQLAQVIQNIVLNANEAMAGSGTVRLSLSNVDITGDMITGLPAGGQFVRIVIQDSGIGIPEQNLAKIFDPYFTTKQKGSGLGLATSYSIIKNHGGVIQVESALNRGTVFTIYLPASRCAEVETAAPAATSVVKKKARILLMDDEELVRNISQTMLASLGHETVIAEDGREAIELFREAREAGAPFDLLILDLTVKGGMGGEEAITKIRDIDPDVKAVVSSGYSDSPAVADYRTYGFSAVLNKPYRIDALKDCLNLFIH